MNNETLNNLNYFLDKVGELSLLEWIGLIAITYRGFRLIRWMYFEVKNAPIIEYNED